MGRGEGETCCSAGFGFSALGLVFATGLRPHTPVRQWPSDAAGFSFEWELTLKKKSFEWELGDPLTLFFADLGKIANAGNQSISHFFITSNVARAKHVCTYA
jgi:hypothetical protein